MLYAHCSAYMLATTFYMPAQNRVPGRSKQAFLEGQDWPCTYLTNAGTRLHDYYYYEERLQW